MGTIPHRKQAGSVVAARVSLRILLNAISNQADQSNYRKGGSLSFISGVDSSVPANSIRVDQVERATNATFRSGPASPRPAFRKRALNFATGVQGPFQQPDGPFQHANKYTGSGVPCLMSSHAGRQFMINLTDFSVQEITPKKVDSSLDINSPVLDIGWSEQVERYWVYQDNQSKAIIFDGSKARRSNLAKKEVPTGNVMCYTQGRLAVALPDRQTFRIGDLTFGESGDPSIDRVDAALHFSENDYLNEGGDLVARVFGAPSNVGPILAMKAGAMGDTALGQGPLLVGTPYNWFTVQLPFDRTTWKNLSSPLQTVNPIHGPLGQDSTVPVNTDFFHRSIDGVRSYKLAVRQFNGSPGNVPISGEVQDVLELDTARLLEHGSGVLFDNRLMMTVSPVSSPLGVWHRGLVVLDFDLTNSISNQRPPAWEGVWSGPRILKALTVMVDMKERCFFYVLSPTNQIELWEMLPNEKFDEGNTSIKMTLDLPSFDCGDSDNFKILETARMVLTGVTGQVSGVLKYRTDQSRCWQDWDTFSACAASEDCGPPDCAGPHTYVEQERTPIRFHMPPGGFDPISGLAYRTGYEFQPRIELNSGWAQIRQFRLYALDKREQLGVTNRNPL
jgi:hypothetical protein